MTRRELREQIFRVLFRLEFNQMDEMMEQIAFAISEVEGISSEDETYIVNKTNKILEVVEDLDATIEKISDGWSIARIGKAELAILRLAVYEMQYDDDVPVKVAINEAVELTKKYCNEDAKGFVNSLLGKIA